MPRLAAPVKFAPVVEPHSHCVDAEGAAAGSRRAQVRGRIADLAAALVAVLDHAFDRERAAEQSRRGAGIAGGERLADPAGRDRLRRRSPERRLRR